MSRALVLLGGVGGGWDSPALDVYERCLQTLPPRGVAVLRPRYRRPGELDECVGDALVGLAFLEDQGVSTAAVAGHSFGGAVAVRAAVRSPLVRTVVTLATQSWGATDVSRLAPGVSILLVHGQDDEVLPPGSSAYVYGLAAEPRQFIIVPHAGHYLDEAADEVYELLVVWVLGALGLGEGGDKVRPWAGEGAA